MAPPADIYSLGVTIWEIICRRPLACTKVDSEGDFSIEPSSKLGDDLVELMKRCLQKNVSDRPTICEIRRFAHTYLHTILIIGGFASDLNVQAVILSEDQTRWIKLQLEPLIALKSPDGGIVYLNDEIYIFGGMRYPKALYKLDKNLKWVRLADMNFGRLWITNSCLEWNGYIWVFGEKGEKLNSLQSVERYDPNNNKWTIMPDMIHPRAVAAAALWNGGIVISGGSTDHGQNNSVEYFNPEDGFWKELPNLPTSLDSHSLVSYKEKLIIMGGRDEETSGKVWELDLVNSQWKPLPSMNYPSKNFAGIAFDQEIYAIGGYDKNYDKMNRVEIFDGANWRDGPRLPCEWSKMSAMTIPWDLADRLCNTYKLE